MTYNNHDLSKSKSRPPFTNASLHCIRLSRLRICKDVCLDNYSCVCVHVRVRGHMSVYVYVLRCVPLSHAMKLRACTYIRHEMILTVERGPKAGETAAFDTRMSSLPYRSMVCWSRDARCALLATWQTTPLTEIFSA